MKNPEKYVRSNILALTPYSTARDEFKGGDISVWIDANESPYDHLPELSRCQVSVNRYPDPHQRQLKQEIAALKGVDTDCIFIGGAGSDEAIDLVYRIFCEPRVDNVVAMSPSYGVYSVAAAINDVQYRPVPLRSDFSLDSDAMLAAADSHTKVMWICSPNNPTANAYPTEQLLELCSKFDGMVVVDEAYTDYSDKGSMLQHVGTVPNLIVMQTFSKAWGMASLRLGMAFAHPAVARLFAMVKYPYNVNGITMAEVSAQIQRDISGQILQVKQQRLQLEKQLAQIKAVKVIYPSDANFLLVKVDDARHMYDYLISKGILVRDRSSQPGCCNCLRLTVGTPDENAKLIKALSEYGHS